jgi:hypothetical protein
MATCDVVNWFKVWIDPKMKLSKRVFTQQQVQTRAWLCPSPVGAMLSDPLFSLQSRI